MYSIYIYIYIHSIHMCIYIYMYISSGYGGTTSIHTSTEKSPSTENLRLQNSGKFPVDLGILPLSCLMCCSCFCCFNPTP